MILWRHRFDQNSNEIIVRISSLLYKTVSRLYFKLDQSPIALQKVLIKLQKDMGNINFLNYIWMSDVYRGNETMEVKVLNVNQWNNRKKIGGKNICFSR